MEPGPSDPGLPPQSGRGPASPGRSVGGLPRLAPPGAGPTSGLLPRLLLRRARHPASVRPRQSPAPRLPGVRNRIQRRALRQRLALVGQRQAQRRGSQVRLPGPPGTGDEPGRFRRRRGDPDPGDIRPPLPAPETGPNGLRGGAGYRHLAKPRRIGLDRPPGLGVRPACRDAAGRDPGTGDPPALPTGSHAHPAGSGAARSTTSATGTTPLS